MPADLDRARLEAEVARLQREEAHRWAVRLIDGTLKAYAVVSPIGSKERYCIRIDFGEQLSIGPPSVTFCNPDTLAEGSPTDWPQGNDNYFKAPPGHTPGWICNEWTREGRAQHAEWNQRGWRASRALWRVVSAMQDIHDTPGNHAGRRAA